MLDQRYDITIQLTEPLLGTIPKNKEVYAKFIASKAAELELAEAEIETVQSINEKGWTGFHMRDDQPFLYNYAIKGFLCESARTLKQFGATKQLQDKFKRYTFVSPREIKLPKQEKWEVLERPLRAMTACGPRVTVTRSDIIPAGTLINFKLDILEGSGISKKCLEEVLSYGKYMGLGQWRSGSFGSFEVKQLEELV